MTVGTSGSNTTTATICPSSKHKRPNIPSKIPLSFSLDCFLFYSQVLLHWFFYPPSDAIEVVVDKLKSTLSEALELYPPVAGTVHSSDDGGAYIAMDNANHPSTPFLFEVKDTPYTDDGSQDFAPRTCLPILPAESCTLAVKVTQLSCGTIVIGCSLHHHVADLRGLLDFVEVWAQLARGEPVDMQRIPDDWSRTPARFFPSLQREPTLPPGFTASPISTTEASNVEEFILPVRTVWKISKSSLNQLKTDLMPQTKDSWISSCDALTSLIFGAITRARENGNVPRGGARSSSESQVETIAITCDCRSRISERYINRVRYFGNLSRNIKLAVTRADLLSATSEAAGRVALAIRSGLKAQNTEEATANYISFFEKHEAIKKTMTADVYLVNWCKFDLQSSNMDFGFGKPFNAVSGLHCSPAPGMTGMIQEKESGDIVFVVGVEEGCADHLTSDPLLKTYATLS